MENKKQIVEKLTAYVERIGSQNKAAKTMKGVSAATISQMINGNWDKIAEEMWKKVAVAVGADDSRWNVAETVAYLQLNTFMEGVQKQSRVMAITAPAGSGKTFASKCYEQSHKNVYRLMCNEFWSKNDFVNELLRAMGVKCDGYTKSERLNVICENLEKQNHPLLIFDEFDKLNDNVWQFLITIYNRLEDQCGIIVLSTDYIQKRMHNGLRWNKKGYPEIYSRMGSKFVELKKISYEDVKLICENNGVTDEAVIEDIARDSEGDLRRVRQMVFGKKNAA